MNEFNEYVREVFSVAGDIVIRSMMGGYLVYLNGKLIGDIGDNELFLKRTPTSDRLLADSELRYPYVPSNFTSLSAKTDEIIIANETVFCR